MCAVLSKKNNANVCGIVTLFNFGDGRGERSHIPVL